MSKNMDDTVGTERDRSIDLESGQEIVKEESWCGSTNDVKQKTELFGRVWNGFVSTAQSSKDEDGVSSCDSLPISAEVSIENLALIADKVIGGEDNVGLSDQNLGGEMPRKKMYKKPPKPPRPPKPSVLDAADQKLVREISELAMLKRARNERLKALRKMRAAKSTSSSNSNVLAMVITIFFVLVIVLQAF